MIARSDDPREAQRLAAISRDSATLWERLAVAEGAQPPLHPAALVETLTPWARVVGRGDPRLLERRLAWDAIDPQRAAAALAGSRPLEAAPWTRDLETYATLAARRAAERATGPREVPDGAADAGASPAGPFAELWRPWVELALERLEREAGGAAGALAPAARSGLEEQLLRDVGWLSEAAAYELFDGLRTAAGGPQTGLYARFVDFCLGDPLGVLYQTYPVLARQTCRLVRQWVEAVAELLSRLAADRAELSATFAGGEELGPVVALETGLSDRHDDGRQVMRLELESGHSLFYKPRELAAEAAFGALLGWCAERGLEEVPPAARLLRRGGYGWMAAERVSELPDRGEARRYHRRAGALLAIAYAMGMEDLHAENLVATEAGPVVVDAEVMLQPEREQLGSGELATGEVPRRRSCLRTGLLGEPTAADAPELGVAVAAALELDGVRLARHREHRRRWLDVGGDSLCGEVEEVLGPPLPNTPRLSGEPLSAEGFGDEVAAGFSAAYRFLLAHRAELLAADGPLESCAEVPVRVLLRASQDYGRVLQLSALPRNQRLGLAGSWLAEALLAAFTEADERPAIWPLVGGERTALERGDVPRFELPAGAAGGGAEAGPVAAPFAASGIEAARRRLLAFGEADLAAQLGRVRWALEPTAVGSSAIADAVRAALATPGEDLATRCRRLAVALAAAIVEGTEAETAPTRLDLATGPLGPALFLAALCRDGGSAEVPPRVRDGTERLLATLRRHHEAGGAPLDLLPPGGLSGLGAALWGLSTLAELTGDRSWLAVAGGVAARLGAPPAAEAPCDLDRGAAGAVLGLLALAEATGEGQPLELAARWGEHLLRRQTLTGSATAGWRNPGGLVQAGWAHGAAGIARALAALAGASGESRFLVAAAAAIAHERTLFDAGAANWPVLLVGSRGRRRGRRFMVAVCRGAAGVALARLFLPQQMHDLALVEERETALDTTAGAPLQALDPLCCGTLGRVSVLLTAAGRLGDRERRRAAEGLAEAVLARAALSGSLRWTEDRYENLRPPAGFLHGASGVGWLLLRLTGTKLAGTQLAGVELPEALALELPSERNPRRDLDD